MKIINIASKLLIVNDTEKAFICGANLDNTPSNTSDSNNTIITGLAKITA
ncbi:hypothetical protein SGP15004_40480 [Shigella flexneri]|nr:hypothetical protein SGP14013_23810 [Shigella flexneri]GLG28454.1 hypothetical protein SGP14014_43060 [Shigella flexneri]GLG37033.1 hypothetical protein SGP15004_40480 [Shigella flexneri]GLG52582.1 hypothetical protein SGP15022_21590 [Shigella flexneri]GLG59388.1 hypothetical protein SGP15023_44380 [Shigella flexneri]